MKIKKQLITGLTTLALVAPLVLGGLSANATQTTPQAKPVQSARPAQATNQQSLKSTPIRTYVISKNGKVYVAYYLNRRLDPKMGIHYYMTTRQFIKLYQKEYKIGRKYYLKYKHSHNHNQSDLQKMLSAEKTFYPYINYAAMQNKQGQKSQKSTKDHHRIRPRKSIKKRSHHKARTKTKRHNRRGRRVVRHVKKSRRQRRRNRRAAHAYRTIRLTKRQTRDQAKHLQQVRKGRQARTALHDVAGFFKSNHRNADQSHADLTFGAIRYHRHNYLITFNNQQGTKSYGNEYVYGFKRRLNFQSDRNFNRKNNIQPNNQGYVYTHYQFGKQRVNVNIQNGSAKSGRHALKPLVRVMNN